VFDQRVFGSPDRVLGSHEASLPGPVDIDREPWNKSRSDGEVA